MLVRCLLLLSLVCGLTACSSFSSKRDWPADMPPRAYFETTYAADAANQQVQTRDDYFTWVLRYYQGWELYRRGWLRMTDELLETVQDPQMVEPIRQKMTDLGLAICGEWAKKTRQRTIHTRHVSVWGNALLESMARGEEWQLITSIQQDVDSLLAREISAEEVTPERYYARDENDPFR